MKIELPQLDKKTNFTLWQIRMRAVLAQLDLEDMLFSTMSTLWTEEQKKLADCKALSQIRLHLSNDILQDVSKGTSVHILWLRLEEICMEKTITHRNLTKQKLFGLHMVKRTSLELHLASFKDILSELDVFNASILIEADLCSLLLMSLLLSYSSFRDILFYGSKELSLDTIYEALSSKESMNKFSTETSLTPPESLVVKGRDQEKKKKPHGPKSKSKNLEYPCNYCKKKGHIKEECYNLQNKNKKSSQENSVDQ
ncbi:unnamed protein product [Spirodela intermedia]|uniref:Uncharacterized protein n=1 Tax=Spirodela intermedia TaxID=51605 RepID=A0A7I8KQV7_SPIIN|nr:unnamed protein product [Spirodela intermedia]